MIRRTLIAVAVGAVVSLTAASCGNDSAGSGTPESVTLTLITHDSFALSDETLASFTAESGIGVDVLTSGDAGQLVSEAILSAGNPLGDVLFGIDNTLLQRGLDADLFVPYESPRLANVATELDVDAEHRVTPVDFGDVCVNYWKAAFDDTLPPPATIADLADPAYAGMFVTENPETSSPGMAFLLATIAEFGDGWADYWARLSDNGVAITSGWQEAYYTEFAAGDGSRPLVTSYASSPPAEVIYAETPISEPPTGVLLDSCYRQIEFAGILRGTAHPDEAAQLIDFMLSPTFQADVPLSMFVFPAVVDTPLPPEFVDFAQVAADPHILDPADVEAHRDDWTEQWTEIVLR